MLKLILAALLVLWSLVPLFGASTSLSLTLTDGSRVTVGEIADVNDSGMTVAAVGKGIRIERRLAWNRISEATLRGEHYSVAELQLATGLSPKQGDPVSYASLEQPFLRQPMGPPPVMSAPPAYAGGSPCDIPFVAPCEPFVAPCAPLPAICSPFGRPRPAFLGTGRVIGVRPDPTSAYADLSPAIYPNGIPSTEAPFALGLLRETRRVQALQPFVAPAVPFGPGTVVPPNFGPTVPAPTGDAVPGDLSQIEARVTPIRNGGTADVNALGVELVGVDNAGHAVPIEGTAQLFLYAGEQRMVRAFDNAYATHPEGLVQLAQWTRNVTPDASLVLRLPQPLPEHNPNISAVGTLRVRLAVPGHGVFETITEPVSLRPASLLRDSLGVETGSRFLPNEKTSGSPTTNWPRQPDLSSVK
jgi:hypothetical protein